MAGDTFDRIDENKLRLRIYFIKNFERTYGWGFISQNSPK